MANPIYRSAYTAQQIEDSIGKSPIISADNEWQIWDIATSAYVGTGIYAGVNTPYVVTDAADMTNTGSLYIYLGADSGIYLNGHWYYYDGASWADGGVYQAAGADADFSLTSVNPLQNKTLTTVFAKFFNSSMNYNEGQYVLYNDLLYVAINDHHGAWDDDDFSAVKMGTEVSKRAKLTIVGSTFDSGTDYDVGDYVIHRGVLYKFRTAHAAGNAWDSTEVNIAQIMDEMWGKANTSDVAAALALKQDVLTFDATPTASSTNPVTSGGVKSYVDSKKAVYLTYGSTALTAVAKAMLAVENGAPLFCDYIPLTEVNELSGGDDYADYVFTGIVDGKNVTMTLTNDDNPHWSKETTTKQDVLTFDDAPTDGSTNPVKSNGIYDALALKANNSDMATALAEKADIDGTYEDLTAGNAEQLVSSIMTEDKAPYLFRTAGGSADIGNREYDTLVGGTVAWNQLVQNGDFASGTGWNASNSGLSVAGNIGTFTATAQNGGILSPAIARIAGHRYLLFASVKLTTATDKIKLYSWGSESSKYFAATTVWQTLGMIITAASSGSATSVINIQDTRSSDWDAVQVQNCMCIDLTQMFGSTIADYVYSLEQNETGSGVAWLKSFGFFTKDYYAYNTGTLASVNATSHDTVGFNQWDEEWRNGFYNSSGVYSANAGFFANKNPIPVLPNTNYYMLKPVAMELFEYDGNGAFLKKTILATGNSFTTTIETSYVNFSTQAQNEYTTYANDICINLSWSGYRNGEYEPYVKHSYPLDSSLTLRGLPKLDANNNLYYDGDTYEADGTVTRKYGYVDLGTVSWTYNSANQIMITSALPKAVGRTNLFCVRYTTINAFWSTISDGNIVGNSNTYDVYIKDSNYTDAAAFKTAMSGVYLVYELATPTTETADAFQSPQIVDDFGTEEYVVTEQSGVSVPVGHTTLYPQNLRDKLQHLPDLAENDGDYLIRQTDSDMELVAYTAPRGVPDAPTTDGNYVLKAVVSGGTATYSWVAE